MNFFSFLACWYKIECQASFVTRQMKRHIWFKSIDQLIPKHSLTLYVLWPVLIISRVSNFPHWVTSLQGLGCRCMNSNLCWVLFNSGAKSSLKQGYREGNDNAGLPLKSDSCQNWMAHTFFSVCPSFGKTVMAVNKYPISKPKQC